MTKLSVSPEECFYIGDGGSHELEAAKELGLYAYQAVWYLKEGTKQPCKRKPEFLQFEHPLDVIREIRCRNIEG